MTKAELEEVKESNHGIVATPCPAPMTMSEQRRGRLSLLASGIVTRTVNSVRDMPTLVEPRFDVDVLNENIVSRVVCTWAYMFRKFEYAVEPTRRGFTAWFRILFSALFYAGLPFLILSALLLGCVYVITQVLAIANATVAILWQVLIGMCLILGVIFLGCVICAVIRTLCRLPIKVPVPIVEFVKPRKTNKGKG